ncbi:MAG: aminotransferase class V-fold PLP-dependent enzyme [Lachnospiraceae bacterium]|nr:aminotransferase class V-fold PLP-dependent enzyme [Lachnospiraceae bacterium]
MIYFDNAATTLVKPPSVGEAVLKALGTFGNSSRGTHAGAMDASMKIYETRVKIANFFNCPRPDHVVFTSNVTEALNTAINGLLKPGDHAISTDLEHNSVLRPLYRLKERGVDVDFVRADRMGRLIYEDFEALMRDNTRLVVCTHASNLTGNVTDLKRISDAAHSHGALLVADAAQTAGTRALDMEALGADVLCFTGHKGLLGPQGTGGMCIREGIKIEPLKTGGTGVQTWLKEQPPQLPVALEAGTLNGHGIAGLSAALDFLNETGLDVIEKKEQALTEMFLHGIKEIPGIAVYGDFSTCHAAIVSLNVGDMDSGEVSDMLSRRYDIATRAGAHCAPRMHEALGTKDQGAVRFSFSYFNEADEIEEALRALKEIAVG